MSSPYGPGSREAEDAFRGQEEEEEIVEIDENGRVYKPGNAPRYADKKPSILRDPLGEYAE